MRIAMDAMGGDHAPAEIMEGLRLAAATHPEAEFLAVALPGTAIPESPNIRAIDCGSVMGMDEDVRAMMRKKDSSIWIATQLVKENEADAVISAGSTAAQMATAALLLGRLPGIDRPAIATVLPTLSGDAVLLDVGANADCDADMLLQFARMGAIYAETLLGKDQPQVALLSNGTEDHKGNKLCREAFALLKESGLNFIGNREGRDLLNGGYDVLVADGMSGNIAIKSAEGAIGVLMKLLKDELTANAKSKLGAALVKPGLSRIKQRLDYQSHGGAPLLGVKGLSFVCHGSSRALAIAQTCELAKKCIEEDFVNRIAQGSKQISIPAGEE